MVFVRLYPHLDTAPFGLILWICRISLSALGRPRHNWASVGRLGAARMLAAFQVGCSDSSIDSFAECCNITDITFVTVLELSTGIAYAQSQYSPQPFSARSFSQQQHQY